MKYSEAGLLGIMIAGAVLISGCLNETMGPDGTGMTSQPTSTVIPPGEGASISGTGTIKFIDLEGGFYGIVSDSGERYDPINLNKEFQVDGLRVRFEAKKRADMASFHMWGTLIEIIKIEKLNK